MNPDTTTTTLAADINFIEQNGIKLPLVVKKPRKRNDVQAPDYLSLGLENASLTSIDTFLGVYTSDKTSVARDLLESVLDRNLRAAAGDKGTGPEAVARIKSYLTNLVNETKSGDTAKAKLAVVEKLRADQSKLTVQVIELNRRLLACKSDKERAVLAKSLQEVTEQLMAIMNQG